jgi:hypothetical protein
MYCSYPGHTPKLGSVAIGNRFGRKDPLLARATSSKTEQKQQAQLIGVASARGCRNNSVRNSEAGQQNSAMLWLCIGCQGL